MPKIPITWLRDLTPRIIGRAYARVVLRVKDDEPVPLMPAR